MKCNLTTQQIQRAIMRFNEKTINTGYASTKGVVINGIDQPITSVTDNLHRPETVSGELGNPYFVPCAGVIFSFLGLCAVYNILTDGFL